MIIWKALMRKYCCWEKKDDTHTVVRFATSWATKMEDVKKLAALL